MPTLLNYVQGDVFTVKVYKRHVNRPDTLWANTYELRATAGLQPSPELRLANVKSAASALGIWERNFHTEQVVFDRYVVSSWEPDGQPYNPATFDSTSYVGVTGLRDTTNAPVMPLEVCLLARKGVAYGRDGRNLYRGALLEADVSSESGSAVLTDVVLLANLMDTADLFADLTAVGFELVMKGSSAGDVVRPVNTFEPTGVSVKKLNNRYFDRTANG